MLVQQISVYLENRPGRLATFTQTLLESGVDMKAICIADTVDFGILRCIVDDEEKAVAALKEKGFAASITEVIALKISDSPGGLDSALDLLNEANVSVEYIYSFMKAINGSAVIIFRVDDAEKAVKVLTESGVEMLSKEDLV